MIGSPAVLRRPPSGTRNDRQGRAGQGRAGQGRAGQGRAGQGRAGGRVRVGGGDPSTPVRLVAIAGSDGDGHTVGSDACAEAFRVRCGRGDRERRARRPRDHSDRRARAVRAGAQPGRALRLRRPAGGGRLGARASRSPCRLRACSRSTGSSCRPVHTFTLADSRNWFALAVFLVTAVVVSELAARSRRPCATRRRCWRRSRARCCSGGVTGELDEIAAVQRLRSGSRAPGSS